MPDLHTIRDSIAELPQGRPLVIALVGATTGIGSYVARAWAATFAQHGSMLRVYIVGRNAARAETLLEFGRKTSPGSDWHFVRVKDLSLIREVDEVSRIIAEQEEASPFAGGPPRLDVLYLSQAQSPVVKSNVTSEGLDAQMSLLYYSRMRFIQNLTPLLLASQGAAHVISIFAGNTEDSVKHNEIPIGTPPPESYGITSVRRNTTFMKTFFFEGLAEKHAGKISFVHIYPGLVDGPGFYIEANPWWFRMAWPVMKLLLSWYMTSPEVCGQVMVFLATERYPAKGTVTEGAEVAHSSQHELGGGAYAVGQRGDESEGVNWAKQRRGNTANEVWKHTTEVLGRIGKSNGAL
ncbi:short-chain dehydrogenase [Stagonosporopsis vannaccii]|nr:short-chain dehydrogenase [Stagonosporopsis vannaccii]